LTLIGTPEIINEISLVYFTNLKPVTFEFTSNYIEDPSTPDVA